MFCCVIMVKKKQRHDFQVGNDDKRKMEPREWIAFAQKENKIDDEMLHKVICSCVRAQWIEELKLTVNVPRSSV